jgi:8-oxo-dGTP pyrophosphatase MutT (NUDIX family)
MTHYDQFTPKIQSVHAILILKSNYLLQLRDDREDIANPGKWSLFGGLKDISETPLDAIKREIYEELMIKPPAFYYLWTQDHYAHFEKEIIRSYFFKSDVSSVWNSHKLIEGSDACAFTFEQLKKLDVPDVMLFAIKRLHKQKNMKETGRLYL